MAKKTKLMPMALQLEKIKYDLVGGGRDPELDDYKAYVDSTLSFPENRKNVANHFGYKIGKDRKSAQGNLGLFSQSRLSDMMGQANDFNRAEKSRRANAARKAKGPVGPRKATKKEFNGMRQLSLWQSDMSMWFPTESQDKARKALPPGRRLSKDGNIYYERRRNRTDIPGKLI